MTQDHKVLIIPDVHGRTFWLSKIRHHNQFDRIVFLGDYLDPYPHEGIRPADALTVLEQIIDIKRQLGDKVVLLLGNHDLHYYSQPYSAVIEHVRYDFRHARAIKSLFRENRNLFQLAYETKQGEMRYLMTHAGVTQVWYNQHRNVIGDLSADNLNRLLLPDMDIRILAEVGPLRGGDYYGGSMVWADVDEMLYSNPFDGVFLVFGHSMQDDEPIITEKLACLDCQRTFVLSNGNIA